MSERRSQPGRLAALAVASFLVAQAGPAPAAEPALCARVQQALEAKKLVLLSFVSAAFARGCGDSETCSDWAEYRGAWLEAHPKDGEAITVPPAGRRSLLRKSRSLPAFATVLVAPGGRAALYPGVVVEPQIYEAMERLVRGQHVDRAWAAEISEVQPGLLRCPKTQPFLPSAE
jgi:hypothetical protein